MEAARQAIAKHTSRSGHVTDVEEIIQPAVVWEKVVPVRTEVVTQAVDREVHQHHYHTTVLPLTQTETLPARHISKVLPVKHVTFQHDDVGATQQLVAAEVAQFTNTSRTDPTRHSGAQLPTAIGAHYHHHVHETVQPIIHKETIAPEVVHTTVPINERHFAAAAHHGMSLLPTKTMNEFLTIVGQGAGKPRTQNYEGSPRGYDEKLATNFERLSMSNNNNNLNRTSSNSSVNRKPVPSRMSIGNRPNELGSPSSPIRNSFNTDYDPSLGRSSTDTASIAAPLTPRTPRSPALANTKYATPNGGDIPDLPTAKHHPSNQNSVGIANADTSPRGSNDTAGRRSFVDNQASKLIHPQDPTRGNVR